MAKRKLLVSLEKGETENGFSMHVLPERPRHSYCGAAYNPLTIDKLKRVQVPLPPLSVQRQIVEEIEAERALIEANRKLVEIFERKIQRKLAEIRIEGVSENV